MKKLRMLEDQFMTHDYNARLMPHKQKTALEQRMEEEDEADLYNDKVNYSNQRLIDAGLRRLMNTKDANVILKDEIAESQLRLKAAKHGHKLNEIVPAYHQSFYLPDKTLYFDK